MNSQLRIRASGLQTMVMLTGRTHLSSRKIMLLANDAADRSQRTLVVRIIEDTINFVTLCNSPRTTQARLQSHHLPLARLHQPGRRALRALKATLDRCNRVPSQCVMSMLPPLSTSLRWTVHENYYQRSIDLGVPPTYRTNVTRHRSMGSL